MPRSRRPFHKAERAAALALLLLAGGCGMPYPLYTPQEVARSYGYSEQALSDASYRVSYVVPSSTGFDTGPANRRAHADAQVALAYDMALWRAADIALQKGFPAFAVTDRVNDVAADLRTDFYDPWPYRWHRRRYPFDPYPYYPYYAYDRTATIGAAVTLTVELRRAAGPGTFDAAAVRAEVMARRPGAGGPPPGS